MSIVYNPEADLKAEIERLELSARDLRVRIERARNKEDKRVLNQQLGEIEDQIEILKAKLP